MAILVFGSFPPFTFNVSFFSGSYEGNASNPPKIAIGIECENRSPPRPSEEYSIFAMLSL